MPSFLFGFGPHNLVLHQSIIDLFNREMDKRMSLISAEVANVVVSVKALDAKFDAAVARIESAKSESAEDLAAVKALGDQVNALVAKVDGIDAATAVDPAPEPAPVDQAVS